MSPGSISSIVNVRRAELKLASHGIKIKTCVRVTIVTGSNKILWRINYLFTSISEWAIVLLIVGKYAWISTIFWNLTRCGFHYWPIECVCLIIERYSRSGWPNIVCLRWGTCISNCVSEHIICTFTICAYWWIVCKAGWVCDFILANFGYVLSVCYDLV